MLNQHASKDELAVVSAANSLLDLCRNAYQQARQQPDIAPHLLRQLAVLQEQATQVLAQLQQDQMQLSQVVALCAQLYALGQELQRKLARKDEPCALITSLETTCYLSQLVTHNLKWASISEQRKALFLGLQPQVEHSITELERVTKGALSSELNDCLNKCYQQCAQVQKALNNAPSQPSEDFAKLTSVLEQLKQQYDELLDIIDPARTQDAGMTVLDKRDAQTQAQAYWLCSPVRACCSHLAQLQAFCAQLSPDDELKLAQLAVTAPEPTEGGQPSDKSAVPLLNAINALLTLSTVVAPEQLKTLAPPLEQIKAAWLNLKSQADVLTALKALRLGCTELESIAAQLKQSLPEQRSFKLQAVRNLHLKRLEQLFAPLVGSADLKLKQELAQVLLTEVSSIEHDLGRTQLSATLAALYEHLVMLTQGRTNYQIERQIDELLQHMVRHASDLLGEHSDQPNFEHAAALEQDYTLFQARHLARTGYHCYQITTELRVFYQDHPKMFGPAIWEQPLQELLNAAELSATFELWAHKGQAQYQLHLAEALTLYQQARPLKEMFIDQVKHFDRVRKNCQHKVDACRKELKQAQGKQNQAKQEKTKQKKKAKVVALEQKLEQLEVKLKQAKHDYDLIKPLLDSVAAIESESYSRFQRLYNAMSWQKVKLIDFVGERQGSELTDILSFKCALFTVGECQRVLKESKAKAEKKILGLIKDQNKARGKQRSAFVALRDYLHLRAKWLVKARWNPVEFAQLRDKYRQKHHLIVEVPADPTPTKNKNKSAAKQAVSTRKLVSRAPSSDRLNYASYTTEYRNPKNCCAFTSQLGGKGTSLKFTLPTNAEEIIQGTFHGKVLGADGLFHNISCELDLGNKKHPDLVWQKLKYKNGEINLQNIKIVYQTLHTNNGHLCKRLAVYSCIPGQPENLSNKVEQIFEVLNNKANGVKRKNNKANGVDSNNDKTNGVENNNDKANGNNKNAGKEAWLKRVVALDLSLQTVAVLSFDGKKFTLLYEDFLQLNTKRRVQQWKCLLRKKEQDQRAYSKYMAKINPRFYDAHDRRLSNAEVYAKFGYIKEWHDNKALRLLNVLREDNRKIAQFRHDAHLRLIYKLLPLGGIVITEQMNYHSLAECARINPLQNGGERNSAAMQREMHQVQFDQEDLSLQTHHRSNKSAQSATSGTSSHRVTGTYAKNQESARDKASAKSASVKSQTTAATLNRAQRRTSGAPVQSNKTNQSKAERMPTQKRSRFGAAIGRAAPASFIQTYKTILAKQGGILVEAPTQLLKATQRNPLLEATPQAFNKLEGGLKQRYKQVLVPSAVNGLDHDIKVWVQRDFMAAFTLMHAVCNEKLIPDKGKTKGRKSDKSKSKVLNDVDVATCRADWAAFMKAYYYTMKHLRDKGLCPDLVKETLRPSKHDLKDHDWRWGLRAWLQIKKTRA